MQTPIAHPQKELVEKDDHNAILPQPDPIVRKHQHWGKFIFIYIYVGLLGVDPSGYQAETRHPLHGCMFDMICSYLAHSNH